MSNMQDPARLQRTSGAGAASGLPDQSFHGVGHPILETKGQPEFSHCDGTQSSHVDTGTSTGFEHMKETDLDSCAVDDSMKQNLS